MVHLFNDHKRKIEPKTATVTNTNALILSTSNPTGMLYFDTGLDLDNIMILGITEIKGNSAPITNWLKYNEIVGHESDIALVVEIGNVSSVTIGAGVVSLTFTYLELE